MTALPVNEIMKEIRAKMHRIRYERYERTPSETVRSGSPGDSWSINDCIDDHPNLVLVGDISPHGARSVCSVHGGALLRSVLSYSCGCKCHMVEQENS